MRLFLCILLVLVIAGCGVNKNSDEVEARLRLQRNVDRICSKLEAGYSADVAISWACRVASNLMALGWIGQNETPDTVWAVDSCSFISVGPNGKGVGWERYERKECGE